MPCSRPLRGFRSRRVNPATGKRPMVFNRRDGYVDMPMTTSCGVCLRCRIAKSRDWAVRCVHEASLYEKNIFITLTYSPKFLPKDGSLKLEHFQNFMKRFRKMFVPPIPKEYKDDKDFCRMWLEEFGIRFFHCGEYGERFERPHYHACIFNFEFEDKVLWRSKRGINLYKSETLKALWPYGFSTVGDVTFQSAAYIARYTTKKLIGLEGQQLYDKMVDPGYGDRKPEYITMSRRPGIATAWFRQFKDDVFPSDEVVLKGKVLTVPKFYGRLLESSSESEYRSIISKRKAKAAVVADDNTPERLEVKEQIAFSKLRLLKRGYEYA